MELSEGIRRIGFHRWYERTLIEGHAWLAAALLGAILLFAGVERLSLRGSGWEPVAFVVLVLGAGGLAAWALHRYLAMLVLAQRAAERSTCGHCAAYGLLELTGKQIARDAVAVRCRKCGNEWTIG